MSQSISLTSAAVLLLVALSTRAQSSNTTDTTAKQLQLMEVKISAQKNAIETRPGKTIVNVEALSGAAGKTALELLRRLPGVSVDGSGNVSMAGKQGVTIMINGRQTYLSGDELRDYLEGLTAEEIAQIEIMSQPSAQYDAAGNAGIINLKLRKTRRKGLNGNANLAWTKSKYESTHNTLLLNYNRGNTNYFTTLNYINGRNGVSWQQDMQFTNPSGAATAKSTLLSEPREMFDKYNLRAGADHTYSEHTHAGFSLSGAYYANQMNTAASTETVFPQGNTEHSYRYTNENSLRKNYSANAYLTHTFSKQSDISVNLDYLRYTKSLYQYLSTEAFINGIALPHQLTLRSRTPLDISIHSARADYSTTVNDIKLETGSKYSYVAVDNAAYFMQYMAGNWANDSSRTNHFVYHEHIAALYINGTKKLSEHWDIQTGIRTEYAYTSGLQQATGQQFTRKLPALFPTAYLSYKPDEENSFELNYGRRVERPHYGMLNPFNYYTFYNTYQRGNPSLRPQYSHNAELKHSYKSKIVTQLSINKESDALTYMSVPDSATQTTYGMPVNFAGNTTANLGITITGKPAPWCELMIHGSGTYALYKGILNDVPVQQAKAGYNLWLNSRFVLGSGWSADCYTTYSSAMAASPVSTAIPTLYSNFGVSKKLFHDTTTIKVTVDDPLYVYRNGNNDVQPGLSNKSRLESNSRYCTFAVSYNFGHTESRKRRNDNQPEEAKRL
jgi:hypothetical protein